MLKAAGLGLLFHSRPKHTMLHRVCCQVLEAINVPRMGWFGGGADPFVRCVAGKPDWLVHGEGGSMFAVSSGSLCVLPSCIVQAVGAGEQPLQDHCQGKLCLLGEGWAASSRSTFGSGAVHARPAVCVICCPVTGRPCTHPLLPCCRLQSRTLSPEWRESFTLIVHSTRYQTLTLVLFDSGGQAWGLGCCGCAGVTGYSRGGQAPACDWLQADLAGDQC